MPDDARTDRVALVIVAHSHYDEWDSLTHLGAAVHELADRLSGSRYDLHLPELLEGGTKGEVEDALGEWLEKTVAPNGRLLLYWTGHGTGNGGHYLVAKDSPRRHLTSLKAIKADVLGEILAKCRAEKILLLLDTCYSSEGSRQIGEIVSRIVSAQTALPGQKRFIGVIPSAHSLQKAKEAVFCRTLVDVLVGHAAERVWDDGDEWIRAGDLRDTLHAAIAAEMGPSWQPPLPVFTGFGDKFLPNPRFRRRAATDVESARLISVPQALVLAGHGIEIHEGGSYFSGRTDLVNRLTGWLLEAEPGIGVLTGQPGSGKSAVLGHLSLASRGDVPSAASFAGAEAGPDALSTALVGRIDAAVHAKGKTAVDCALLIGDALGLPRPAGTGTLFDALAARMRARDRRAVVVLDALDESPDPGAIAALVGRIVREAGARVLVGSRRSPDGRVVPLTEERHARLRNLFGGATAIIDLDDEPATARDIADYVRARLRESRHRDAPQAIDDVAERIAVQARGIFLYARIVTRTLRDAERLDGPLPASPFEALAFDLRERFGDDAARLSELLAGLAWAEGEGVSRRIWPVLANAASAADRAYSDQDIAWVLDKAGWHILQAQEADQTVYRLVHQAFADHYREQATDAGAIHRRIVELSAGGIAGTGWLDADGYLARHLATHAARGGVLDPLVRDAGYLSVADPLRLLPVLSQLRAQESRTIAAVYRRSAAWMSTADFLERTAILHLSAVQEAPPTARWLTPLLTPRWRARWADWRQTVPSTTVPNVSARAKVATLASVAGAGTTLVLGTTPVPGSTLSGAQSELRSIALETLAELPPVQITGEITTLTPVRAGVHSFVIAGTKQGGIAVVRLPAGEVVAERGDAHAAAVSSATVVPGDTPRLATASADGSVALWSIPELELITRRSGLAERPLSVAATILDEQPVLVASGDIYGREAEFRAPATVLSVPALESMATFGVGDSLLDRLQILEVDREPIVLGTRHSVVRAFRVRTGERMTISAPDADDPRAAYFLPYRTGDRQAVALNDAGMHRNLLVSRSRGAITLEVSPWVETGFGQWLGPVSLWGQHHLLSVFDGTIRLWGVEDLEAAIAAAPLTSDEMFHHQKAHGIQSVTGIDDEVWAGGHSGVLRGWQASDGLGLRGRSRFPASSHAGEPVALVATTVDGHAALIAGYADGVIQISAAANGARTPARIDVHGKLSALAVSPPGNPALLAAATKTSAGGKSTHQVRLWSLPSLQEIPTLGDPELEPYGYPADRWKLEVPGSKNEDLLAVAFASSPNGLLVLGAGRAPAIVGWNAATFEPVVQFAVPGPDCRVTSLTCRDTRVVAGTDRGTVVGWSTDSPSPRFEVDAHDRGTVCVAHVRVGTTDLVATGGRDSRLRTWSTRGGPVHEIHIGTPTIDAIKSIAQLPDGGIAVGTLRGVVVLDLADPAAPPRAPVR